jgi:hypothetical protein
MAPENSARWQDQKVTKEDGSWVVDGYVTDEKGWIHDVVPTLLIWLS